MNCPHCGKLIVGIKTRKEILESHRNSALAKLLEDEINLTALQKRIKGKKPGVDYDKLQEAIKVKEITIKRVKLVLKIVDDMLVVELDQGVGKNKIPKSKPKPEPVIGLKL